MKLRLAIILLLFALNGAVVAKAGQDTVYGEESAAEAQLLYLDVDASTWRPRGRISFSITPTLRLKLSSAGLVVTDDPGRPRDATMKVEYREQRGKQISVNQFGTDIICLIRLDDRQNTPTLSLVIQESPSYSDLVNAPYVEVVEKLQANPYFYFIGDIVRQHMQTHIDTVGALIMALERQFDRDLHPRTATSMDTLVSPGETFPDLDLVYSAAAQLNAIDELGRLKDSRAVTLLERLTSHPNRLTRLQSVLSLEHFDDPSIASLMAQVAEVDSDEQVRNAAAGVVAKLSVH